MLAAGVEDAGRPAVRILDNDVGDPLARAGEFGDRVATSRQLVDDALRQAAERAVFDEEVVAEGYAHADETRIC